MRAPTILLTLPLLVACAAPSGPPETPREERLPQPPLLETFQLPVDWDARSPAEFEAFVLERLPEDARVLLEEPTLEELSRALDREDQSSVRAAVLLGRARTEGAGNVLFRRLAKRVVPSSRPADAGDVVAAAALARFPRPERWWRIVRLVDGANPHPDLEVRVECAATALHMGFDQVIPFLLQVLRIDTWDGRADQLDFVPGDHTAWARGRAAEALSTRAGIPLTYRFDGPIADREHEARRLASLLRKAAETAVRIE